MNTEVLNLSAKSAIATYRKAAQAYGPYFGQVLLTVVTTNPDLKWKEDCVNGKQTLRNEVKAFVIKAIDIVGIKFIEKDLDGYPKIVLNPESNDPNLTFPVSVPEFPKATRETVMDCIDRIGKANAKPMFFSAQDMPMLVQIVNSANQAALNTYEEMSRKMSTLSQTVRDMMDATLKMQYDYNRQCGVNEADLQVNITIENSEA